MSRFVWAMAWRETRGSFRHFVFFFFCIALGVGALLGVNGFASNMETAIQKEARNLMAGDLEIRSSQPLSSKGAQTVRALEAGGIRSVALQELLAMGSDPAGTASQLVELKAVGPGYPFYGQLITEPSGAISAAISGDGALVEETLLIRLGLGRGDRIRLGRAVFTIAGVIRKEPDRVAGAFSLGPRVMISQKGLVLTELVQPGSRVRYRTLLRLPEGVDLESVKQEMESALIGENVRVTSYQESQPRLRRFLKNLTAYLGLAGFTALLIGGIGVANSVRAFLDGKLDTLAILKCLGAGSGVIARIYLLQTLLLGLVGSLMGVGLGFGALLLLSFLLADFLPAGLEWTWPIGPVVSSVTFGLLVTLLFALWPLLRVRDVPPALVFRRHVASSMEPEKSVKRGRPKTAAAAVFGIITTGLAFLAVWQAGSLHRGGLYTGLLAAALALMWLSGGLMIRVLKAIRRPRSMAWRHGLANLYRPGSQASTTVLSLGVGVAVILAVQLVEGGLERQIGDNIPKDAPSFFFIDIQTDQKDRFEQLLRQGNRTADLTPIVRARLFAVGDTEVAGMDLSGRSDAWYFSREYVVTSAETLPPENRVKRGRWWDSGTDPDRPQISVEEEAAQHLGLDLGSVLTFDIQGAMITATVTSLREVHWGSLSTNFFMIFSPGALEGMPTTYIAAVQTRPEEEVSIQREAVAAFPNVTAINIRHVLEAVRHVLEQLGRAVRLMTAFAIAAGVVVLAGAVAATRRRRTRETVILKTLGATRTQVARIYIVEYGVLGFIAGLSGAGLACLLAFVLLKWVFDIPWYMDPRHLIIGVAATVVLTILTGFLTTFRILGQKPLAVLRNE